MRVVIDIEANSIVKPTHIWVIVCKDIDTGEYHVFREPSEKTDVRSEFLRLAGTVTLWVGHNWLGYDLPALQTIFGFDSPTVLEDSIDTLICSRLIDYSRPAGHSVNAYGVEFGLPKLEFNEFKSYSPEMELYCTRDVDITHRIYLKYLKYLSNPLHKKSITLEHKFQYLVVNALSNNGFTLNVSKAQRLLKSVEAELAVLDKDIKEAFPPKLKLVREITPRVTKHGTLSRTDFRWLPEKDGAIDLSLFNGGPFCRCVWMDFNASSPKQIVDVLNSAGWRPVDKTKGHIECERELKRNRKDLDLRAKYVKLLKYGWKVNELNLETLPPDAPAPARTLAKRIMYESRRRTLTEWLGLVQDDGRIHGKFLGIGTWTHRMATQQPNMQNIPNELDTNGKVKFLGKELRSLWQAPRNRLLVGVDAEGIQLRLLAHLIDDEEFTNALVKGRKANKTDPHSLNQRIIGPICKHRQASKRFIYALILGAGLPKLAEILECDEQQAQEGLDRIMDRYTGWSKLKKDTIPNDAKRGYIVGLDGRKVALPGSTPGERRHLAMSAYLQAGEAVVMKAAALKWWEMLDAADGMERLRIPISKAAGVSDKEYKGPITSGKIKLVNMVHDEWQTETPNDMEVSIWVAEKQSRALREVGEELELKCPMAGSYWSDDHNDYTIGTNWAQTH